MPFICTPTRPSLPDAHLGLGATVGSVIPNPRGDHARGRRRRHRVRHDRREDAIRDAHRPSTVGTSRSFASRSSAAIPLLAGTRQPARSSPTRAEPRVRNSRPLAEKAGFDPANYAGHWREQALGLASAAASLHRDLGREHDVWMFCTPAPGASAKPHRASNQIKVASAPGEAVVDRASASDLALPRRGTPEFARTNKSRDALGSFLDKRPSEELERITHAHSPSQRCHLAKGGVGVAQGRDPWPACAVEPGRSRDHGRAVVRRGGQGQPSP
ncbi:hypothetical protein FQR65_LT20458 [Abscondita terminalis]|nr:hypothetical protein FQR65_LT20458 [Abscondita terminalis]